MKVNSINNLYNYNNKQSFKRTAVPYPEYAYACNENDSVLNTLANKISQLFSPKVTKDAVEIKSKIDKIYDPASLPHREQLLSVLA